MLDHLPLAVVDIAVEVAKPVAFPGQIQDLGSIDAAVGGVTEGAVGGVGIVDAGEAAEGVEGEGADQAAGIGMGMELLVDPGEGFGSREGRLGEVGEEAAGVVVVGAGLAGWGLSGLEASLTVVAAGCRTAGLLLFCSTMGSPSRRTPRAWC
jgi:hypothetical protein